MRKMILFVLLVAGCADGQSTANANIPKYIGKPPSLVFQRWGQPDREIPAEGGSIYQWRVQNARGVCRLEAHANNPLYGDRGQAIVGIHGRGEDSTCASWYALLR